MKSKTQTPTLQREVDLHDDTALLHLQNALVSGILDAQPLSTQYTNAALAMALWQILSTFRHVWPEIHRLRQFWAKHQAEYDALCRVVDGLDTLPSPPMRKDVWS